MIFVTVGTNEARFDRLLEAVVRLGDSEQIIVQHGASTVRPPNADNVDFLPFDQLVERVRAARLVVSHAGVGSIMVALANGKRPVVVPRMRRYREAVDDHQLSFARRLDSAGLVTLVEDPSALSHAVESAPTRIAARPSGPTPLVGELRSIIKSRVPRDGAATRPAEPAGDSPGR
jgi:UDP-N-acetylglucosamine transferase subunit ALG13